jgi:hypothetical protein
LPCDPGDERNLGRPMFDRLLEFFCAIETVCEMTVWGSLCLYRSRFWEKSIPRSLCNWLIPIRGEYDRCFQSHKKWNLIEMHLIHDCNRLIFAGSNPSMSRSRVFLRITKPASGFHPLLLHPESIPEYRRHGTTFDIRRIPNFDNVANDLDCPPGFDIWESL